jgi:hypothetical protein
MSHASNRKQPRIQILPLESRTFRLPASKNLLDFASPLLRLAPYVNRLKMAQCFVGRRMEDRKEATSYCQVPMLASWLAEDVIYITMLYTASRVVQVIYSSYESKKSIACWDDDEAPIS